MPDIARAVALLRAGELVAMPTETVYGLGADAANAAAVARIFAAKGRPADHPLIVHLPDAGHLSQWAAAVPVAASRLAAACWPGPLTLILRRAAGVSDAVTGGQDTVGLRVPGHPVALALLKSFGGGIAAPSANRFGRISPTTAAHVREELGTSVALILDGGPCAVGIESTIVDCSAGPPRILRPGALDAATLSAACGSPVAVGAAPAATSPRVSGSLEAHYAPATPLLLVAAADLDAAVAALLRAGYRPGVLARRPGRAGSGQWCQAPGDASAYAHDLYAALRELDHAGLDAILVEAPPAESSWLAIADRLRRAAAGAPAAPDGRLKFLARAS